MPLSGILLFGLLPGQFGLAGALVPVLSVHAAFRLRLCYLFGSGSLFWRGVAALGHCCCCLLDAAGAFAALLSCSRTLFSMLLEFSPGLLGVFGLGRWAQQ